MSIHSRVSLLRSPTISMMICYKTVTRNKTKSFIWVWPHSSAGTSDNAFIPDFYWLITVAAPSLLSAVFIFRLRFVHVQHHQLVCAPTTAVFRKSTAADNTTTDLLWTAGQQTRRHPAQTKKGWKLSLGAWILKFVFVGGGESWLFIFSSIFPLMQHPSRSKTRSNCKPIPPPLDK